MAAYQSEAMTAAVVTGSRVHILTAGGPKGLAPQRILTFPEQVSAVSLFSLTSAMTSSQVNLLASLCLKGGPVPRAVFLAKSANVQARQQWHLRTWPFYPLCRLGSNCGWQSASGTPTQFASSLSMPQISRQLPQSMFARGSRAPFSSAASQIPIHLLPPEAKTVVSSSLWALLTARLRTTFWRQAPVRNDD